MHNLVGQTSSCALRFPGPKDSGTGPVTVFVAYSEDNQGRDAITYAISWNGLAKQSAFTSGETMGQRPVCGHARRSDGKTSVYFFYERERDATPWVRSILVNTDSIESMRDTLQNQSPLGGATDQRVLPVFHDKLDTDYDSRLAVTYWLGDHRSLILPSGSRESFVYNANTDSFSRGPTIDEERGSGLFITEATQVDRSNLRCT